MRSIKVEFLRSKIRIASQAKPFAVRLAGHEFSGSYLGICALKADNNGVLEKAVCGGFTELPRDGEIIVSLPHPADVLIRRVNEKYQVTAFSTMNTQSPVNEYVTGKSV